MFYRVSQGRKRRLSAIVIVIIANGKVVDRGTPDERRHR